MPTLHYTVDTNPMANTMTSVQRHVDGVTTTVGLMQTAVVAAEAAAANKISENVNRGFFSLMHSQITQKIAKYSSAIEASLNELAQYASALAKVKVRMEVDYHRITGRYLKIFTGLTRDMENRIYELDKPTIDLVRRDLNTMTKRMDSLASFFATSQNESVLSSTIIEVSNTKSDAQYSITSMADYMETEKDQNERVESLLQPFNREATVYLPVIVVENTAEGGTRRTSFYAPQNAPYRLDERLRRSVSGIVMQNPSKVEYESADSKDYALVRKEMTNMLGGLKGDARVAEYIKRMIAG